MNDPGLDCQVPGPEPTQKPLAGWSANTDACCPPGGGCPLSDVPKRHQEASCQLDSRKWALSLPIPGSGRFCQPAQEGRATAATQMGRKFNFSRPLPG